MPSGILSYTKMRPTSRWKSRQHAKRVVVVIHCSAQQKTVKCQTTLKTIATNSSNNNQNLESFVSRCFKKVNIVLRRRAHCDNCNNKSSKFYNLFTPMCNSWPAAAPLSIIFITIAIISTLASAASINHTTTNIKNATSTQQQRAGKLLLQQQQHDETDALGYLQRYGYLNETQATANLIAEDSFHDAVMSFQRFAGIPETGYVDTLTTKYMHMPRCGNKDKSGRGEAGKKRRRKRKRRKRYALQGSKWRRQELTYRISQYPSKFANRKHEVDAQIEKAFRIWSTVAPIDFVVKKDGRVHIDIRFTSGEHGDGDPFDGPGNTLAHAYFPQYGGDAHFDDQEFWTIDSYAGTNIFQVAAHELGHSLGLGHSSVREALMAPFYQKYKPNFKLHADDVLGIQALYGEGGDRSSADGNSAPTPTTPVTTTTTSTTTVETPSNPGGFFNFGGFNGAGGSASKPVDLCTDPRVDAITRTEDGSTYVFRGSHYWLVTGDGLAKGYPQKITRGWDGLPTNLDAALTWSDGKTFFFKGDKYWRFFNKRREPGYPKLISAGFAGIPNNVDAAFVWSGNGKTYFFKNDKYWRFDSKQEPPVGSQYPKPVSNWVGLPARGVDAAFKWENGMTYFFADDLYYRFDDREFEVDSEARPAFPRSTAEWWFGCQNSNLPILASSVGGAKHKDKESGDLSADGSSSSASTTAASEQHQPAASRSLSRSFFDTLSALLPSSSSYHSPANTRNASQSASDWSFHRGTGGEEFKQRNSNNNQHQTSMSRWSLPLAAAGAGSSAALAASGE